MTRNASAGPGTTTRVAIVGGGAWGTALAVHLGGVGLDVRLWMRERELVARMHERRDNPTYLPGVRIPETVLACGELLAAVEGAEVVFTVVPTQFTRTVYGKLARHLRDDTPVVVGTKGIEVETLMLPLEVVADVLGAERPSAVLSGPSFAREVAEGKPTALVVASTNAELSGRLQRVVSSSVIRVYTNQDPLGVQLSGALKNVMAIAAGVADSLGLGTNAVASLITRGLAEMARLVLALGGQAGTTSGLAGMGDLVLTCTGELSRNRRVGQRLGRGERLKDILAGSRSVAEGVRTARSARDLARRAGVEMPIVEEVYRILYEDGSPHEALARLIRRPLRAEEGPSDAPA